MKSKKIRMVVLVLSTLTVVSGWAVTFDDDVNVSSNLTVNRNATVNTNLIVLNGNVGIGTNTPTANLHVARSGSPTIKVQTLSSATDFARLWLLGRYSDGAVADWRLVADNSIGIDKFVIYGGRNGVNGYRLVIGNEGNVGVGTSAPTNKLQVAGTAQMAALRITGTTGSYIAPQGDISMGIYTNTP